MKKILLILSLFVSFSFATVVSYGSSCYEINEPYSTVYSDGNNIVEGGYYHGGTYRLNTIYPYSTWKSLRCAATGYCTGYDAGYIYYVGLNYYATPIDCLPTCTESDSQNSDCTCKTGYEPFLDSGGNQEGCQSICTTSQYYNSDTGTCYEECNALSNTYENGSGGCYTCNGNTLEEILNCRCSNEIDGGSYSDTILTTYIEEFDGINYTFGKAVCDDSILSIPVYLKDDRCDTVVNPLDSIPVGYLYKGLVENESICSSYNDGINYISSITSSVNPNCLSNSNLYCYLLPLDKDTNETNAEIPTLNDTGTIAYNDLNQTPNINYNSDNADTQSQLLTSLNTNMKNLSSDNSKFNAWYKDKFNDWTPQSNYTNKLNAQNLTTSAVNNVKSSVENVTSAINNQNSNLGSKLDTINQSITDLNLSVDISGEIDRVMDYLEGEDTDNDGTGYIISDINTSLDSSLIDDFIATFTTAWDNMKLDIDSVSIEGNSLISRLKTDREGGFSFSLPRANVTECPYISEIDFSSLKDGLIYEVSIDLCKPFSAVYPVFYILFSIMFTIFIVVFGFKSLMRLV